MDIKNPTAPCLTLHMRHKLDWGRGAKFAVFDCVGLGVQLAMAVSGSTTAPSVSTTSSLTCAPHDRTWRCRPTGRAAVDCRPPATRTCSAADTATTRSPTCASTASTPSNTCQFRLIVHSTNRRQHSRNALFDALRQLSGTHYRKLFSAVTLWQFLSLG